MLDQSQGIEADKPAARHTLRGQLVARILHEIFRGDVRGGDRLIEEELASKLGVSRTPVREALGELAAIGFIRLMPNRGAVVRPFGPEQIRDFYHVRRLMEEEATRLAATRIDRAALKSIREQTQAMMSKKSRGQSWAVAALALDQQFHELISRSSGSERLAEEIGKYRNLVVAVGDAVGNTLHAHDQNLGEHMEVIDHLLEGRAEPAALAMGRHINRGAETASQVLGLIFNESGMLKSASH
jgi:DNA-binding GntR family transcriptional regulator